MKINKLDSKKYFVESVLSALPKEHRNKAIVKKTLLILQSIFAPGNNEKPFVFNKYNLAKNAWNELMVTLKGKERLSANEIAYVKFIEQEIFNIACGSEPGEEEKLLDYRQSSPIGITNTCCYLCGSLLERHSSKRNLHYCSQKENLICYKKHKATAKKQQVEWKLFTFVDGAFKKPYCAECHKLIVYSIGGEKFLYDELPFCNKKHMERYRKREQRKHNRLRILTSKT